MKLTRREFMHLSTAAAVAGGVTLLPVGQAAALAAPSVQQLVEEAENNGPACYFMDCLE